MEGRSGGICRASRGIFAGGFPGAAGVRPSTALAPRVERVVPNALAWEGGFAATHWGQRVPPRSSAAPVVESALNEAGEGRAVETAGRPVSEAAGAEAFVDVDGGLVPVEHGPLHAAAAAGVGQAGDVMKEAGAESVSAKGRAHIKIFQPEAWFAHE